MKINNGIGTQNIQNNANKQPQAVLDPSGDGEGTGGEYKNVVNKLINGDFKGKGMSHYRLQLAHDVEPGLGGLEVPPETAPEGVPSNAYEKFLEQHNAKYAAPEPDPVEPPAPVAAPALTIEPPVTEEPSGAEVPEPAPVEPSSTTVEPPAAEEPVEPPVAEIPLEEIPVADPVSIAPLEIEPIVIPEQTEPEVPVDEGEGALAALKEILEDQAVEEEYEPLDIVL